MNRSCSDSSKRPRDAGHPQRGPPVRTFEQSGGSAGTGGSGKGVPTPGNACEHRRRSIVRQRATARSRSGRPKPLCAAIPLVMRVDEQTVPSLAIELLRVARWGPGRARVRRRARRRRRRGRRPRRADGSRTAGFASTIRRATRAASSRRSMCSTGRSIGTACGPARSDRQHRSRARRSTTTRRSRRRCRASRSTRSSSRTSSTRAGSRGRRGRHAPSSRCSCSSVLPSSPPRHGSSPVAARSSPRLHRTAAARWRGRVRRQGVSSSTAQRPHSRSCSCMSRCSCSRSANPRASGGVSSARCSGSARRRLAWPESSTRPAGSSRASCRAPTCCAASAASTSRR